MKLFGLQYYKAPTKTPRFSHLYLKLRSQFTLYFLLLVIIPCSITAVIIYFQTRGFMEDNAREAALESIAYEKAAVGRYLGELELALGAAVDSIPHSEQKRLINAAVTEKQSHPLSDMIDDNFTPGQQKALSAVYFITNDGVKASFGPDADQAAISNPSSQQWFYDTASDPSTVRHLGTMQRFYAEGKNQAVLCAAKSLKSINEIDSQVVLLFDFNYSLLTDFMSDSVETGDSISGISQRMIIDFNGNILYSKDQGKLTIKADDSLLNATSTINQGFTRHHLDGADYYLTYVKYPAFNWIFIDLNPVSNVIGRLWIRSPLVAVCLIVLPIILLIFPVVLMRLLKPINDLTSVISDYENKFPGGSAQIPLIQGKSSVSTAFGSTSDVDLLINKIYSIKLSQKEAELNSLQNQINPHFLYNTLESIRGAALYHGINDIAAMSKALSLLFRYSISERVLVSIKEEMQHLENYISIQNFRYENKFDMIYSIPPDLLNYKILKLTLQPLIENSIKHGLEMKLGKGTIRLEILELENNIKIQISDDGLGIPSKRLDELNRALSSGKYQPESEGDRVRTGIGVMNVSSRIKLYFGEQYGLKFRNAPVGTTVEITLPAVKEN